MPIYKPGQLPQTGISWVDALLRAMHEDPTSAGPSAFGVPLKMLPEGVMARGLVQQLAKRMPKLHKAVQRSPDVKIKYPADVPAARYRPPLQRRNSDYSYSRKGKEFT